MSEPKNFDQEYKLIERPKHSFILGGMEFHTKGYMSPEVFLNRERGIYASFQIIEACLVTDEIEVFQKLIGDKTALISADQVDAIADWIFEAESGRPTQRQSKSGDGPEVTSSS